MLWQFTFLTPFNAHLQLVEGSQPLFFCGNDGTCMERSRMPPGTVDFFGRLERELCDAG